MTNETKIKVPKKYHCMIKSICYDLRCKSYSVVLEKGYEGIKPYSYPLGKGCYVEILTVAFSQKKVLDFIRSIRPIEEPVPAPAPEETIAEEDIANVDANNTAVPVKQAHVPSAVAVDASETAPDQEGTAPVVDDQRVLDRNQYYCRFRFPDTLKVCPVLYGCIPECQPP